MINYDIFILFSFIRKHSNFYQKKEFIGEDMLHSVHLHVVNLEAANRQIDDKITLKNILQLIVR